MLKKIGFSIIVFLISIVIAELGLRIMGFKPGNANKSYWIRDVDDLQNLNGYKSDSLGIFKMDTSYRYLIADDNFKKVFDYGMPLKEDNLIGTYSGLGLDFFEVRHGLNESHLANKYNALLEKSSWTDVDSAVFDYIINPLNNDGFFSIEFKRFESPKPKILLIGDSFTWGHSTTNKAFSFANELLAQDYVVYNAGISGTDVAQYEAIAKEYIPKLQPDIVILSFYLGNDVSYYKRTATPYQPVFYPTNAGNLLAFQHGIYYKTPEEAYDQVMSMFKVPTNTPIRKLASKFSITSLMWSAWRKLGMTGFPEQVNSHEPSLKPSCNEELLNIKEISETNGAKFELVVIPDFQYGKTDPNDFPYLFENIGYKMSPVTWEDYKHSDGHFNDEGHKKYTDFILNQINSNE